MDSLATPARIAHALREELAVIQLWFELGYEDQAVRGAIERCTALTDLLRSLEAFA